MHEASSIKTSSVNKTTSSVKRQDIKRQQASSIKAFMYTTAQNSCGRNGFKRDPMLAIISSPPFKVGLFDFLQIPSLPSFLLSSSSSSSSCHPPPPPVPPHFLYPTAKSPGASRVPHDPPPIPDSQIPGCFQNPAWPLPTYTR